MPGLLCSTWAEQELEMPQQQWWPAEEHLVFFRTAWLGIGHIHCNMSCICCSSVLPRAQAVCWSSAGNEEYHLLLGSWATRWKSHHRQAAFQCERVPANYAGSDKLVKPCRLTFASGESCLYLGKLSDIRVIHLLLQASRSVFLQVKSNSCCWHEKQGRQAE